MRFLRALCLAAIAAGLIVGLQSATETPPASAAMALPADSNVAAAPESTEAADTRRAREVLAGLADTYRHLEGVTVTVGNTPRGEQAVAYYTDGEIVIDRGHSETIERILAHEIWHIIDWRDNSRLDWGENLPPHNSSDYFSN